MSATDVKVEKQARRHRGPLVGIAVAGLFAVVLLVFMLSNVFDGETDETLVPSTASEAAQ